MEKWKTWRTCLTMFFPSFYCSIFQFLLLQGAERLTHCHRPEGSPPRAMSHLCFEKIKNSSTWVGWAREPTRCGDAGERDGRA